MLDPNFVDDAKSRIIGEIRREQFKHAFSVGWRAADRLKRTQFDRISYLLATNSPARPLMISGDDFRRALAIAVRGPFR